MNKEKRKQLNRLITDIKHISTIRPYEIFSPYDKNPEYLRWEDKVTATIHGIFEENSREIKAFYNIFKTYFQPVVNTRNNVLVYNYDIKKMKWVDRYNMNQQFKAFFEYCKEELTEQSLVESSVNIQLEEMLHPLIIEISYAQYKQGHYKDAILNGINALYSHIREKTNCTEDGKNLIGKVFSVKNPKLIISNLDTNSGENEQQGFIQLFNGLYQGVRNPNSHGLKNSFTELETVQYLIFISLLVGKIDNAKVVND